MCDRRPAVAAVEDEGRVGEVPCCVCIEEDVEDALFSTDASMKLLN